MFSDPYCSCPGLTDGLGFTHTGDNLCTFSSQPRHWLQRPVVEQSRGAGWDVEENSTRAITTDKSRKAVYF